MKHSIFLLLLGASLISETLRGQVPPLVNYQGRVAVGSVNFDGTGQFKFALVNSTGSTTYWSNNGTSVNGSEPTAAVSLPVIKGLYSVLLGDASVANMTAIPGSVFNNADVRLRVWFNNGVNGSQLLTPDQRMAPTAYLADGAVTTAKIAGGAVTSAQIANGAVTGNQMAVNSVDATRFAVPGAPATGQVLGYNGSGLTWTAPGGGVFSLSGTNAYYNGGNVGIGTMSPLTKLEVNTAGGSLGFSHTDGTIRVGSYIGGSSSGATGGWLGTISNHALHLFVNDGQPALTVNPVSSIGIGTSTPNYKLHLYDPGSVTEVIETGGNTNSWTQLRFKNVNGEWVTGTSRSYQGDAYYIDRLGTAPIELLLAPNGNLGLGIYPQAKLDIYDAASVVERISTGGGTNAYTQLQFANGNGQWDIGTSRNFNNDDFYIARQGAATNAFSIETNGDAFLQGTMSCKVLTIRGGADLAEPFPMKEEKLEKGSVVVIDAEHPGRLKRSTQAYDRRVAGIVSGANGVNPGIALHQEGLMDGSDNVALSGRVYVEADASASAIAPGDLLTTSDRPGHAMKVTDHARAQGAVIGKAMSSLEEGTGMVLVLVTLQ